MLAIGQHYTLEVGDYTTTWMLITYDPMTARFKHISGSNLAFLPSIDGTYAFTYDYALIRFKPIPKIQPIKYIKEHRL